MGKIYKMNTSIFHQILKTVHSLLKADMWAYDYIKIRD